MPHTTSDDSWLSALTVPLIIGACLGFVMIMATGSSDSPARPPRRAYRERAPRRREKQRKESLCDWEIIPTSCKVPVEIIERIIDYLHDDRSTLKACTLAGRACIPRARYHLHSTLTIKRGGPDPYALWQMPAVAQYIRRVLVRDGLWDELNRSILVELGYVERLRLRNSHDEAHRTMTIEDFPNFPNLVELRMSNVAFGSRKDLFTVLEQLHRLSTLHIDVTSMDYIDGPPHDDDLQNPVAIAQPRFSLPLAAVHLSVRARPGSIAQEILAIAGSSLKELSVVIVTLSNTLHSTLKTIRGLGLHRSTSLETFSLHFLWGDPLWYAPSQRLDQDKHLASSILACISSPHLHTLHFRIVVPLEDDPARWLRFLDMRFLDGFAKPPPNATLSLRDNERALERSKCLQKLRVEMRFMSELQASMYVDVRRHVEDQLPELRRRKMLEISFSRS